MNRQLLWLNLLLAALIVLASWRLRASIEEGDQQIREMRARAAQKPTVVAPPPLAPVPPVTAANYLDVARQMLFARDRNPNVIVDPEPPKQKPVMPALPSAHGLMMFGAKPSVILSVQGIAQRAYQPGDKVGPFKLISVDPKEIVFEWEGEKVVRRLSEIAARVDGSGGSNAGAGSTNAAAISGGAGAGTIPMQTTQSNTQSVGNFKPGGPGADIGAGFRACQVGDATPSGTVVDGFRKIMSEGAFGKSCRWEAAR